MGFHVLVTKTTGQTDHVELPTIEEALTLAREVQQQIAVMAVSIYSPSWRVIRNLQLAAVTGRLAEALHQGRGPSRIS